MESLFKKKILIILTQPSGIGAAFMSTYDAARNLTRYKNHSFQSKSKQCSFSKIDHLLFTWMNNSRPNLGAKHRRERWKILPLPSLATNPVRSLKAAMQHKQDRTFLFGTYWKNKWAAFLNAHWLWQGGMAQIVSIAEE